MHSSSGQVLVEVIAHPVFVRNCVLRSSCPGMGFIIIIGSPFTRLSLVVSPPGFVIMQSEASIIVEM